VPSFILWPVLTHTGALNKNVKLQTALKPFKLYAAMSVTVLQEEKCNPTAIKLCITFFFILM